MAKIRRSRRRKTKNYQPDGKHSIKSYIIGLCASILITMVLLALWSIVLTVSSVSESSMQIYVTITLIISVFCGGFICTMGTRRNGWISGGVVGILYILILLVFGSGMATTETSFFSLINIGFAFLVGGIGGTTALNI